jgi:acetolactate synthase-1/2/3 large subunit
MNRVADYIARTLADRAITDVFLVTGGGAMHLNDAFGRERRLRCTPFHHEQACAMAADSYFRATGKIAAVNVTTGPGGTNAITGVYGAWVDSLGMVVVSGQVKWETLVRSTGLPLRQLGDQEVDIVRLVEPITKYAAMVERPETIRYHLEKAIHRATTGRPGPVWLDVPMNVQGAPIPANMVGFDPAEDAVDAPPHPSREAILDVLGRLQRAKRPVVFAGAGVRISGAHAAFLELVGRLGIPVVTGWNAHDALSDDHPCYAGRPGTIGDRAGNFAVQNADVLLVLGSRLNIRQVSYNWASFARAAFKIQIDVDALELQKPTVRPDLPVHADLSAFLPAMLSEVWTPNPEHAGWLAQCHTWRAKYPTVLPSQWAGRDRVNPYCFAERLFELLDDDAWVVTGDGTACVVTFQAAKLKPSQRLYTNSGSAPMGYDLPGAIGASLAGGRRRVVCLAGDGSIMMNLQELQTIATQRLPIAIFVLNNEGYHSIRQTQAAYFPDNEIGCGPASGVEFPDFERLASAFRLGYRRVATHDDLNRVLRATLDDPAPSICEVVLDPAQPFSPKLASRKLSDGRMVSSPLEDMAPFLDRAELAENLFVEPWEDP